MLSDGGDREFSSGGVEVVSLLLIAFDLFASGLEASVALRRSLPNRTFLRDRRSHRM